VRGHLVEGVQDDDGWSVVTLTSNENYVGSFLSNVSISFPTLVLPCIFVIAVCSVLPKAFGVHCAGLDVSGLSGPLQIR